MEHNNHADGGHGGHMKAPGEHAGHMIADFRRRFWICLALTVPILLLSPGKVAPATSP